MEGQCVICRREEFDPAAGHDDRHAFVECDCWDVHASVDLTAISCGCPCHLDKPHSVVLDSQKGG